MLEGTAGEVRLLDERAVGSASVGEGPNAMRSLDGAAESVLVCGDAFEPLRCEIAQARLLVRVTEDARNTAQPRPTEAVCGCWYDAVAAQHRPNSSFV